MSFGQIIFVLWLYVTILWIYCRETAKFLNKEDFAYFNFKDEKFPSFGLESSAIRQMVFDSDLPYPEYTKKLKNMIYMMRFMYILFVPLLIIMLFI
jgi:hypothetical protein